MAANAGFSYSHIFCPPLSVAFTHCWQIVSNMKNNGVSEIRVADAYAGFAAADLGTGLRLGFDTS